MKELLAQEISRRVKDGETLGVGTGTTVDAALTKIGARVKAEGIRISVVPTSIQSAWRCEEIGLQVLSPLSREELSWGFDGADAVDARCRLIKGKGGAMLQEKVLAAKCRHYVIIADEGKFTENIGALCPVPVEVIPEAAGLAERALRDAGASEVRVRQAVAKHGPVITEAGNIILDCRFPSVSDSLEGDLKKIMGVVETGLFLSYAHEVLIAGASGIRTLKRSGS